MAHLGKLALAGMVFWMACAPSREKAKQLLIADETLQIDYRLWKQDRRGCVGDRKEEVAVRIAESFARSCPSREQVETWLGAAEAENEVEGKRILTYFYDTQCDAGELVDGMVYCVLEIEYAMNGKYTKAGVVCG